MATLCIPANSSLPVLANDTSSTVTARAASFYWFEGMEMTACTPYSSTLWNMVLFSTETNGIPPASSDVSGMPHDIVFSHDYIHGVPNQDNMIRGLYFEGYNFTVIDSTVNNWQASWQDSQAIMMDCGTGGILVQNSDVEASANSILFAAPQCLLSPGDITIVHNLFTKPLSWGGVFITKNFVEFKNGQRALIEQNVIENGTIGGSKLCWNHANATDLDDQSSS
jgi:hypothetical protein